MDTPDRDDHEREYLRLLRATPVPVAIHREGRWRFLNDAALELLGIDDASELVGLPVADVVPEEDRDVAAARRARVEGEGRAVEAREFRIVRPDGDVLHVESRSIPVTYERRPSSLTTVRDVTEARKAQRALRRSEAKFRSVAESATDAIVTIDSATRIVYANPASERMYGYAAEELVGALFTRLVPERHRDTFRRSVARYLETGDRSRPWVGVPLVGLRRDGDEIRTEISFGEFEIEGERFFTGIVRDVTERERARRQLERSELRYRQLFEDSLDAVYLTDPVGTILEMNSAGLEMFGYTADEVGDISAEDLYAEPADRLRFQREIAARGSVAGYEVRLRRKTGESFDALISATEDMGEDGSPEGYKGIIRDITERKEFEVQLERRALHDPLTELPNRALFWDRLESAIRRASRQGGALGLLFMDLDRFKTINDTFGHLAGDQLLASVATRLQAAVRDPDTVARFGGDEFIVLVENLVDPDDLRHVAGRILENFKSPFRLGGEDVQVTTSIGTVMTRAGQMADVTPREWGEELVRRADRAMYRAKARPGTRVSMYDPALDEEGRDALHRESELRRAIERPEFLLHYQPIIRLDSGRIVAVEALARWQHPERGLLAPGQFLSLAEETGLIVPLGEHLLEVACRQVAGWNERLRADLPLFLHVNMSPRQFEAPDFVARLSDVLDRTGLPRRQLELEITEHLVFHYRERTRELRELGIGISVDDFGTGYASLGYVKNLAADVLKIDQEFVQGIDADVRDRAIVKMIISLADTLELDVVAEGVETAAQLARLRELGCGWGQGYYFAHPGPAEICERLLREDPTW